MGLDSWAVAWGMGRVMGDFGGGRGAALLSAIDLDGPVEVVMLLKRTGVVLGGWSRNDVPHNVISVMAATMIGSVSTLLEALGGRSPPSIDIEAGEHRMHVSRADPQSVIVLVAPLVVSGQALREESDRLASVLSRLPEDRICEQTRVATRT